MVETQLRRRGIRDQRVLAAMLQVPREQFVSPETRLLAYSDEPLQIGFGQTISQPYMTALMAQELGLNGSESVLEVGAGSGYAAALLGVLAARVITVEIIPGLAALAERNLLRTGRAGNIRVIAGDGSWGFAAGAPYDAISVAAGAPDIPPALVEEVDRKAHRLWDAYDGPRTFRAERMAFVQNTLGNCWIDLAESDLGAVAV